jgi:hypothetical protein
MHDAGAGPFGATFEDELDALEADVDAAFAVDAVGAPGPDLDAAVRRAGVLKARVEALEAKLVGEWDAQGRWAGHGSRSAAASLAHQRRVPAAVCGRAPKLARKLRAFPAVRAAWEAGAIDTAHVEKICGADSRRVHDDLVADQVLVTRWAMELRWKAFCQKLAEWLDEHDQEGAEPDGRASRRFHCSRTLDDRLALDGLLDTVGGSIFAKELERLERKLWDEDVAEARERLGYDPLQHQLRRTPEQRRADALVLMAERSATGPEDGRRGTVLISVLVGHDSLTRILELSNGIALRAGQVIPWLDAAAIEQVLFDGPSTVVKVSNKRNFTGVVRKAVEVRDRGCQHPTCDEPIDRCQADHIIPWSADGPTSQENGRLLCGYHNRLRNSRGDPDDDPDH